MNETSTGGPTFPAPEAGMEHFSAPSAYMGMSLRDCFAAKALQAIVSKTKSAKVPAGGTSTAYMEAALGAYGYADAMIKARDLLQPAS